MSVSLSYEGHLEDVAMALLGLLLRNVSEAYQLIIFNLSLSCDIPLSLSHTVLLTLILICICMHIQSI